MDEKLAQYQQQDNEDASLAARIERAVGLLQRVEWRGRAACEGNTMGNIAYTDACPVCLAYAGGLAHRNGCELAAFLTEVEK